MTTRRNAVTLLALGAGAAAAAPPAGWPLWEAYARRFLQQGRVVDFDRGNSTTSEGQSYALFFALVANDRPRFEALLQWTIENLAQGDLSARLPSWHWGRRPSGAWGVLDENAASDADLWIAYTLIEAGRLWKRPEYRDLGLALARLIDEQEVAMPCGLGAMLLPGPVGFVREEGTFQFNPSYVPLPLLHGLAAAQPAGPWKRIADTVPALLAGSAPKGFPLDWIAYHCESGFSPDPTPASPLLASYDAIRVYLWAGLTHPNTPQRATSLRALRGMADHLRRFRFPPAEVSVDGTIRDPRGNTGFSSAVLPYLRAIGARDLEELNRARVRSAFDPASGLYDRPARYYEQNLTLFALGWSEGRYSFDPTGKLQVSWR